MKLDGYTFPDEPSDMTEVITEQKDCTSVRTYTSRTFFSWGTALQTSVQLTWDLMTVAMFDMLVAMANTSDIVPHVFDPEDGSGKLYEVWLGTPQGKYSNTVMETRRKDVTMTLFVKAEYTV